jgi:hypothetical protein
MIRRRDRVLARIFAQPMPADLHWSDIESVLRAAGAEISEGRGSRVRVALNGVRAVFHRPHPRPEVKKGAVRAVRDFLVAAGIRPEE